MSIGTTPAIDPLNALTEAKRQLEALEGYLVTKTNNLNNAISQRDGAHQQVLVLSEEVNTATQQKRALEQWIHTQETDGSEYKDDFRSYTLWLMQKNKHTYFHFRKDLIPLLRNAGFQFLDKNGQPLREAQVEDKVNSFLNKECKEGGNVKSYFPGGTKRGGHFQWTDVPNPKEVTIPEVVSTQTPPSTKKSSAAPIESRRNVSEEDAQNWMNHVLNEIDGGKRFFLKELKNSWRNFGRKSNFWFEEALDDAIESIDAIVRQGTRVEMWWRNAGLTAKESAEFVYQRAGGSAMPAAEGWDRYFPPERPPKVPLFHRPTPKLVK